MDDTFLHFITSRFPALITKLIEQIYLSGAAILIAIIISIPLGIWIVRKKRLRNYVLGITSVLQTIPSLAVLGFLLPFFGIGVETAIVTLTIYSLLPILRNTVSGLLNVPAPMREAADGLGFTKYQKMWMVELPLALPIIVAGIRTATAMSVGIATIAAFVGAGGLGDFIYEGLSLNNTRLILLGAIPAAILALLLDYIIGNFEKALISRKTKHKKPFSFYFSILLSAFFLLLVLIKPIQAFFSNNQNVIRIGTKNFTEQLILGELISKLIERNTNLKVIKKFNLGSTIVSHNAIIKGEIDLYPEYSGTAYVVILKRPVTGNATQVWQTVKKEYAQKFQLVWLQPFGFNNTNALAVRKDFAEQNHLITISDMVPIANRLSIGVSGDFIDRPDGYRGLIKVYGIKFNAVRLMDPGLMYKAIALKQVDSIMAYSTDGRIPNYNLVILQDDKHLFPPYEAAPVIRNETLEQHPEIIQALQPILGKITNQIMQKLNYEVDVLKRSPSDVAENFLHSLLPPAGEGGRRPDEGGY